MVCILSQLNPIRNLTVQFSFHLVCCLWSLKIAFSIRVSCRLHLYMYFLRARAFHLSRPSCYPSFGDNRKLKMSSFCDFLHFLLYSLSGRSHCSSLLEIPYLIDKFECEIPLVIKPTGHRFGNRSSGLPAKGLVDFKRQFNPTNHRPIEIITRPLTGSKFSIWNN